MSSDNPNDNSMDNELNVENTLEVREISELPVYDGNAYVQNNETVDAVTTHDTIEEAIQTVDEVVNEVINTPTIDEPTNEVLNMPAMEQLPPSLLNTIFDAINANMIQNSVPSSRRTSLNASNLVNKLSEVVPAVVPAIVPAIVNPKSTPSVANSRRSSKSDSISTVSQRPSVTGKIMERKIYPSDSNADIDWFAQREYIMFKNELTSQRKINIFILKECKENKRLLDLKYDDLTKTVNNIQTSVIFISTLSGFIQAIKSEIGLSSGIIDIISITISTYISLILSVSKYYKFDEIKEQIQNLREKYSLLHNKIEHRMDVLGPWNNRHLWEYKNASEKLAEWREVLNDMNEQYKNIIETKQALTTEFEIIMDTISRNKYNSINADRNYSNRMELFNTQKKEDYLEKRIVQEKLNHSKDYRPSIVLQHEELDNWEEEDSVV